MTARDAESAEFVTSQPDMAQLPTTDASGPRIGSGGSTGAEFAAIECSFTVERSGGLGAMGESSLVKFKGYATPTLYAALADAIGKVVG